MGTSAIHRLLLLAAFAVFLGACQPGTASAPVAVPASGCEAGSEVLANLPYSSELVESGRVRLEGGEYRAPAAPGSASEVVATLTEFQDCGMLHDIPSAAVILESSGGGSGTFYTLHAVQPMDGAPLEAAYAMLGDRVMVEGVAIGDDLIFVDMLIHATDDPQCCPTVPAVRTYRLEGFELELVSETPKSES